jgi:hypothetical protein
MKGEKIPTAVVLSHLGYDGPSPELSAQAREMIAKAVDGYRLNSPRSAPPMLQAAE